CIMGPQDGVDGVLEIAHKVVREHGREDVQFALLGFGDCLEDLRKQCSELGLDDYVTFTGRVGPKEIADYLSTAEIGLSADPLSPLNDVSTMNKTMEYMAYALPVVAYRLTETVVSAGDCAVYLEPGDVDGFAKEVVVLVDHTKVGVDTMYQTVPMDGISHVVTDAGASPDEIAACRTAGADVLVAQ
ncbi:glycosyltransferase, partial [Kibdelosporangium lantanae]